MQRSIRIFDHNEDANLFELLRKKRWEIAQKQKVPAFMIFSDRSLHDMAKIKPQNKAELLQVTGIGKAKMERYGDIVINAISEYEN